MLDNKYASDLLLGQGANRTVNGQASGENGFDDLKTLENEVLGIIQKKVGPAAYFAIYQNIRQHSLDIKEERRSQHTMEAIANPELAAKRKPAHNQRRSSSNKCIRFT